MSTHAASPSLGPASAAGRPNILFITTDQQRADCIGYENDQVRTPHLDALACRGARFSNCITPSPVCQPARASILTGRLPLTHGVWDNGVDLDPAVGQQGVAGGAGGGRVCHRVHRQGAFLHQEHVRAHRGARVPPKRTRISAGLARALHGLCARRTGRDGKIPPGPFANECGGHPSLRALVSRSPGCPRNVAAQPARRQRRGADMGFGPARRLAQQRMGGGPHPGTAAAAPGSG